jgi:hypothetical protein
LSAPIENPSTCPISARAPEENSKITTTKIKNFLSIVKTPFTCIFQDSLLTANQTAATPISKTTFVALQAILLLPHREIRVSVSLENYLL